MEIKLTKNNFIEFVLIVITPLSFMGLVLGNSNYKIIYGVYLFFIGILWGIK